MLKERADLIVATTEQLKAKHNPLDLFALRQIGEERGIKVVETSKALVNISLFNPDLGWFIFYRRSRFMERSLAGLAHELGHAVLNHNRMDRNPLSYDGKEEEADFFAETLLGIEPYLLNQMVLDEFHKLLTHPLIYLSLYNPIGRGISLNRYCALFLKEIGNNLVAPSAS